MAKKTLSLDTKLKEVLRAYRDSFSMKTYSEENDEPDPLMDVFRITPNRKRENRQYWGTQLGRCWEKLVVGVLEHHCNQFALGVTDGKDRPCDCCVASDAIDAKYRIGSGDSGFQKNLGPYSKLLKERGYRPVLLIVRDDSLKGAISRAKKEGWTVLQSQATF